MFVVPEVVAAADSAGEARGLSELAGGLGLLDGDGDLGAVGIDIDAMDEDAPLKIDV